MLIQPVLQQLQTLRLNGMANALEHQLTTGHDQPLSFEERLGLLIQHELDARAAFRLTQRLRYAKLPLPACLEDIDTKTPRGITPAQLAQLTDLAWLRQHLNVLITGPTGVGKSYLASALAHAACRADYAVRCFRLPRLVDELARHTALQKRATFFRHLAKADLLVLDDFGITPLTDSVVRDLLEILDDRYDRRATLITSQLPLDQWHAALGDRTVADAILDRLVHNAYKINLKGESMRKRKTITPPAASTAAQPR